MLVSERTNRGFKSEPIMNDAGQGVQSRASLTGGERRQVQQVGSHGAGALAEHGDAVLSAELSHRRIVAVFPYRIASERADVAVDPAQSLRLITKGEVGGARLVS